MNIRGYDVTIIAKILDEDSYTATRMFLRELAITFKEAARMNQVEGFDFAADSLLNDAKKITEALDILEYDKCSA